MAQKNLTLLSFILPIFNTGKYLPKCIESTLVQGFDENEFEVLLIFDEGTTDNSLIIAQEYASKYSNIRLICHSNRSIGASLNFAFPLASGKYIEVVDTDDFLEPNKIKPLISRMESDNLDILRFDYQNVNENYDIIFPNKNPKQFVNYSENITNGIDFLTNRLGYACYVPTFIFKKSILIKPGNEMLPIAINDTEWLPRIVTQAARISSRKEVIYNYLIREGSKMHSSNKQKQIINYKIELIDSLINSGVLNNKSTSKWYKVVIANTVISILSSIARFSTQDSYYYLNLIKSYNLFPLSFRHQSLRNKVRLIIIHISPILYTHILNIIR